MPVFFNFDTIKIDEQHSKDLQEAIKNGYRPIKKCKCHNPIVPQNTPISKH